jgi:hypothetical protein
MLSSPSSVITGEVQVVTGSKISRDASYKSGYRLLTDDAAEVELRVKRGNFKVGHSFKPVLIFSASLTSYERMKIHEFAEELGCSHESFGVGKDRYVEVSTIDNVDINSQIETNSRTVFLGKTDFSEPDVTHSMSACEQNNSSSSPDKHDSPKKSNRDDLRFLSNFAARVKSSPPIPDLNEDELLKKLAQERTELEEEQKYRIKSSPLENYEKVKARNSLHGILSSKQAMRSGVSHVKKVEVPAKDPSALWNGNPLVRGKSEKTFRKPPSKKV